MHTFIWLLYYMFRLPGWLAQQRKESLLKALQATVASSETSHVISSSPSLAKLINASSQPKWPKGRARESKVTTLVFKTFSRH